MNAEQYKKLEEYGFLRHEIKEISSILESPEDQVKTDKIEHEKFLELKLMREEMEKSDRDEKYCREGDFTPLNL